MHLLLHHQSSSQSPQSCSDRMNHVSPVKATSYKGFCSKHTKRKSKSTNAHTSRSSHSRRSILRNLRRSNSASHHIRARSPGDNDTARGGSRGSRRSSRGGDRASAGRVEGALDGEVAAGQNFADVVVVHIVVIVGFDVVLLHTSLAGGDQSVGVGGVTDALEFSVVVV